jgi:hypothetical protein|tara:strand:- start:8501 stop:9253 length:753 start_codon:yes stop_codon:yes gene_type:complete
MFDPKMNEAFVHCDPISNTKELTQLFYNMTGEIWTDLDFGDQTYLNVYMQRPKDLMTKRDIYNGLRGFDMKDESNWLDYVTETQYETGVLYYVKLRKENARIEDHQWLNIYCFVHKDFRELGKKYWDELEQTIPDLRSNYWFSYMEHDCCFQWHTDGDTGFRYHHVLLNDGEGVTSSIETSDGSVFRNPGEGFILNTAKPHSVVPCRSVRLHAVASVNGPKSTRKDHNNQWLEDTNKTWKDWEREHGYST